MGGCGIHGTRSSVYLGASVRARTAIYSPLPPPPHPHIQLLLRPLEAPLQIDALVLFQRFLHHGYGLLLARNVFDHHRSHERPAALSQGDEAGSLGRSGTGAVTLQQLLQYRLEFGYPE
jgi:hypothetical protein